MRGRFVLLGLVLLALALSRVPGVLPANFSAMYAFAFCAGVFLRGPMGWWLPISFLLVTDIALNLYYHSQGVDVFAADKLRYLLVNYSGYVGLIWLGRRFQARDSFLTLLGGGLLGALLFYIVTNTMAWLFNPFHNPEYLKNLVGWIIAVTKGTAGYPPAWEFFRNTLLGGGLFTALFVAIQRAVSAESPADKGEPAEPAPAETEPEEGPA